MLNLHNANVKPKPNQQTNLELFTCVCLLLCTLLSHTTQRRTILIIFVLSSRQSSLLGWW